MNDPGPLTSAHFHVDWGGPPGSHAFLRVEFGAFASANTSRSSPASRATGLPRQLAGQVVLTRIFTGDPALASWAREGGARDVMVKIERADGRPASHIQLVQATVVAWTLSPLDSMASALLTESLTLAVGTLAFPK